jgi:hypothetical protein
VKFQWTLDCEKSFQHLKKLLTSAPILRIADPNEDFVVHIDACKEGLGGVLSQNGFVSCYESRKLKEHESHYATHDLELEAIVHALRKWRHYFMGKEKKVDDAINRRVHELHATTISMYQSYSKDIILEDAKLDLQYKELVEKLQQGILQHKIEDYKLENDEILIYRGIIYVPNS